MRPAKKKKKDFKSMSKGKGPAESDGAAGKPKRPMLTKCFGWWINLPRHAADAAAAANEHAAEAADNSNRLRQRTLQEERKSLQPYPNLSASDEQQLKEMFTKLNSMPLEEQRKAIDKYDQKKKLLLQSFNLKRQHDMLNKKEKVILNGRKNISNDATLPKSALPFSFGTLHTGNTVPAVCHHKADIAL